MQQPWLGIGTEVLTPDVLATNGVVHIIDHVLPGLKRLRDGPLATGKRLSL